MAAFADDDFSRFITREKRGLDRVEAWRLVALVAGSWAAVGYGQWIAEERATGLAVGRLGPWAPGRLAGFRDRLVDLPAATRARAMRSRAPPRRSSGRTRRSGRDHVIHLIDPANAASARVAERLGGRETGRWMVPTGEEIPVWTTRWENFMETDAYTNHLTAGA